MTIIETIKNKVIGNKDNSYSKEREEGLRLAKQMAQRKDPEEEYRRQKYEFERQQAKEKYNNSIRGKINQVARNAVQNVTYRRVPTKTSDGRVVYRVQARRAVPQFQRQGSGSAVRRSPSGNKYQGKKGYMGRGRPKGPSGKYIIPGKGAVSVFEWRKWARYQRRMQEMQQQQRIAEMMQKNPQAAVEYQQNAQNTQLQPQGSQIIRQQVHRPYPNQPVYPVQRQPVQTSTGLQMVGSWDLLKTSMNTQNVPARPIDVFNVEKPVTNPGGEYYTEPDFFSGKQVLRRRPTDRFNLW